MSLLIEAAYQNSVCDIYDMKDMFLSYAIQQDSKLHEKGIKPKYLNAYNIRHIITHIPDNRQIEFINWFWERHCHVVKKYRKRDSFAGRRVAIMMSSLQESALWKHLENAEIQELSDRELRSLGKERQLIQAFIANVFEEGMHMQYVKIVLGKDNFYEKLHVLMGKSYVDAYDLKVDKQKQIEEEEKAEEERQEKQTRYKKLIERVRQKYDIETEQLQWHGLNDKKNPHINLWNYWQGSNFAQVKLMVLGFDWGSVNDDNQEMKECKRKIQILMNNRNDKTTKYYSCKYRKTDYNLECFFKQCFHRDLRKTRYSDLYFSNLCLGYRKLSNIHIDDEIVLSDIRDFMHDELSVINPQVILCLGEKVYQLLIEGIHAGGNDSFIEIDEEHRIKVRNILIDDAEIRVYAMPHCGVTGIREMSLERQLKIWGAVKEDMKEIGIVL